MDALFRRNFDAARDPLTARNALEITGVNSWTPTITFATPGDVSVAYSSQIGRHIKIGPLVTVWFNIGTSTFTHTTAASSLLITGLPYTPSTSIFWTGGIADITNLIPGANFTTAGCEILSGSIGIISNNLVAGTRAFIGAAHHTSGNNCVIRGNISYCI